MSLNTHIDNMIDLYKFCLLKGPLEPDRCSYACFTRTWISQVLNSRYVISHVCFRLSKASINPHLSTHYKKLWFLQQQGLPQYVDISLQKVYCGNLKNYYKVAKDSPLRKNFRGKFGFATDYIAFVANFNLPQIGICYKAYNLQHAPFTTKSIFATRR